MGGMIYSRSLERPPPPAAPPPPLILTMSNAELMELLPTLKSLDDDDRLAMMADHWGGGDANDDLRNRRRAYISLLREVRVLVVALINVDAVDAAVDMARDYGEQLPVADVVTDL